MWSAEAIAKKDIPLIDGNKSKVIIKAGSKITITKGPRDKYCLWSRTGIWDLPDEYVGEITVLSKE